MCRTHFSSHSAMQTHCAALFAFALMLTAPCLRAAPPAASPSVPVPMPPADKLRTWKDNQGRSIVASLRGYDAGDLILWLQDGRVARVSLKSLSSDDQQYAVFHVEELTGGLSFTPALAASPTSTSSIASGPTAPSRPATTASTSPASTVAAGTASGKPIGGAWPARVALPISSVQCRVISENAEAKKFVYQTGHFEYQSEGQLGQAVMSDVSRIFEATYTLLSQGPWGVLATPDNGKFRAELFETQGSYFATGAPRNSGGVYLLQERVFRVPFESLGLKETNRGWTKDENYGTRTLVHELTHMLHHDILPLLPMWVAEGMAEYTESIPFRSSTFWVDSIHDGVKAYNKGKDTGRPPPLYSLSETMTLTAGEWRTGGRSRGGGGLVIVNYDPQQALYHSGLLLVYYFMHLEGDGKGTRFLKFLEAARQDVPAWRVYEQAFANYRKQMDLFMKQPGVKELGAGRFSYPAGMTPPAAPRAPFGGEMSQLPFRHMDILLNGKTAAQVGQEAEAALKKAGLELNYR